MSVQMTWWNLLDEHDNKGHHFLRTKLTKENQNDFWLTSWISDQFLLKSIKKMGLCELSGVHFLCQKNVWQLTFYWLLVVMVKKKKEKRKRKEYPVRILHFYHFLFLSSGILTFSITKRFSTRTSIKVLFHQQSINVMPRLIVIVP